MNFAEKVYALCKKIPAGKVTTYGEIGMALGVKSYQAIGQVLKKNKYPDIIPCFKVVRSSGELGGYCGSNHNNIKKKIEKLKEDGVEVIAGRIDIKKYLFKF